MISYFCLLTEIHGALVTIHYNHVIDFEPAWSSYRDHDAVQVLIYQLFVSLWKYHLVPLL